MKLGILVNTRAWQFAALFIVAVVLNYPWELAQARLYVGMTSWVAMRWHCLLASVGDGVLIWIISAIGCAVFKRDDWYRRPSIRTLALMAASGLAISVGIEWVAVNILGRWQYTARMPLLPGLGVGLVPVLQMLLLPPAIFRITTLCTGKKRVASDTEKNNMPSQARHN